MSRSGTESNDSRALSFEVLLPRRGRELTGSTRSRLTRSLPYLHCWAWELRFRCWEPAGVCGGHWHRMPSHHEPRPQCGIDRQKQWQHQQNRRLAVVLRSGRLTLPRRLGCCGIYSLLLGRSRSYEGILWTKSLLAG